MIEDAKETITAIALKQVVLKFIPPQFIKNVNLSKLGFDSREVLEDGGVELLQKLMDNSTDDIRMFGTAEDLAEDLRIYRNFTSSHKFFGFDISEVYHVQPRMFRNDRGDLFICKQDLLPDLQQYFAREYTNELESKQKQKEQKNRALKRNPLVHSVVSIFLKTYEEELNGSCEFVKCTEKILENNLFVKGYPVPHEDGRCIYGNHHPYPTASNVDSVFKEWKGFIRGWTDEKYEPIRKALKTHFQKYPYKEEMMTYLDAAWFTRLYLFNLQNAIDNYPEYFLPATSISMKLVPISVRVFQTCACLCQKTFVMKAEFFKAMHMLFPSTTLFRHEDTNGYVQSMRFEDVKEQYGKFISRIEFISIPIRLTTKPVPIMTTTGDYCIHVSQARRQIIAHLTLVLKIFRKIKKESWHLVEKYMEWLADQLGSSINFVTISKIESIEKYTNNFFKKFENVPAKRVSDVGVNGFSLPEFKEELEALGLVDVFPDILDHSEDVYTIMMRSENKLNTKDMFEAVERCQLKCVLKLFPKIFSDPPPQETKEVESVEYEKVENSEDEDSFVSAEENFEEPEDITPLGSSNSELSEVRLFEIFNFDSQKDFTIDELSKENGKLFEKNEQLRESFAQKDQEIEKLKQKNASLENSLKDQEILKSKLSNYENNQAKIKDFDKEMTASNQNLTKKVAALGAQLETEKRKIQKIEKESKQKEIDLNRKINKLEKDALDNKRTIAELNRKEDNSQAQLKRLADSNSDNTETIALLESKLASKNSEIEKLNENRQEILETDTMEDGKYQRLQSLIESHERRISELIRSNMKLLTDKEHLESLLEIEKQNTRDLANGKIPQLERLSGERDDIDLEKENFELRSVNNELRETNIRLTGQVEEQKMMIKSFFEQFGQVQKSYSNSSCQTIPVELMTGYTGVKHHLWSLQKIKDSFRKGHQLKQAKEMVEKLWNQPEIQEMATYELQQYEAQLHHYLQSIEVNIQKIKKTGECTQLDPIPDFPTFSDRFLREYWKLIDDKNSESNVSEHISAQDPTDLECLICLIEMTPKEKTIKCEHCKKVLHLKCASEWLRRHRSCPHCRRELLDPTEFPPLS